MKAHDVCQMAGHEYAPLGAPNRPCVWCGTPKPYKTLYTPPGLLSTERLNRVSDAIYADWAKRDD